MFKRYGVAPRVTELVECDRCGALWPLRSSNWMAEGPPVVEDKPPPETPRHRCTLGFACKERQRIARTTGKM